MAPNLADLGNGCPFPVLPPGIHTSTLTEVKEYFAYAPWRIRLFNGFCLGIGSLAAAGCSKIYLNGSYTAAKSQPRDLRACREVTDVVAINVDGTLFNIENERALQKQKFGGEFFILFPIRQKAQVLLDFFQTDRYTGKQKGILLINCDVPLG